MAKKSANSSSSAKTTTTTKGKAGGEGGGEAGLPEGVRIRRYEEADWDEVCKLVWKGACVGNDSEMAIGLRNLHLQPLSVAAYYLFATGVAAMYFKPTWVPLPEGFNHTFLGAVICFGAAAWAIYWRWEYRKAVWDGCRRAWREDMSLKELGKTYGFEGEGVGGFWVAEGEVDGKKAVVGCVGLDPLSQRDKATVELRRLAVSPVEKYRHKGVGKALLAQAVAHAREQRKRKRPVRKLVARTTTYQPAAWELLQKEGWKVTGKKSVSLLKSQIYEYTMELEL
ncbi:hypothetical protein DFP72DRAFT_862244 [Ephemerocybe angulata]|uniref:N-acetyltransferase domain-containing protein n=1 Tax=Ephemerocybe angulata TaxID=980116 RepID=A0A8H6H6M4_9AGAR|nr:hypothetical protein DFP72DRAFT_862244 [Tulosesus angulatus]